MAISVEVARDWWIVLPTIGAAVASGTMAFFTWRAISQTREVQEETKRQRERDERCRRLNEIRDWASGIVMFGSNLRMPTSLDEELSSALFEMTLRYAEMTIRGTAMKINAVGLSDEVVSAVEKTRDAVDRFTRALQKTLDEVLRTRQLSDERAQEIRASMGEVTSTGSTLVSITTQALRDEKDCLGSTVSSGS